MCQTTTHFSKFPCHEGHDAVLNEPCEYLSLSGSWLPDDSAVSRDVSQSIDVSDYKQAGSQQEALEFWFVDMRPLAQSYLSPPPFSINSISIFSSIRVHY